MPAKAFTFVLCLLLVSTVQAQTTDVGGATKSYLSQIRNQSIGNSYTIDQVNRRTINQSRARIGIAGVGAGGVSQSTLSTPSALPRRQAARFDSFGAGPRSGSKPFSNASRRPTVSPYLNLFRDSLTDGADNYNTLVRPQLEQQRLNQSIQRQSVEINRRVQAISARPAFNPQGSQVAAPTGHSTGFMYYSHYYSLGQQRRGR